MTMKYRRHGVGVRVPRREDSRDLAGPELRYRQHARVEDRIRELKATGRTNVPCQSLDSNAAWLGIVLAATDLVAGSQLIGFTDHP